MEDCIIFLLSFLNIDCKSTAIILISKQISIFFVQKIITCNFFVPKEEYL